MFSPKKVIHVFKDGEVPPTVRAVRLSVGREQVKLLERVIDAVEGDTELS